MCGQCHSCQGDREAVATHEGGLPGWWVLQVGQGPGWACAAKCVREGDEQEAGDWRGRWLKCQVFQED